MITKRGLVLLILAIAAYAAVVVVENPAFLFLAGILLTLLALGFVHVWVTSFGITCQLTCPRQAIVGETVRLKLAIHNRWPIPRHALHWRVTFPPAAPDGIFIWAWLDTLRPFGDQELQVPALARSRGHFQVGQPTLHYTDPLGLFARERTWRHASAIDVLPAFVDLDTFPFIEAGAGFRDPEKTMPTPGFSNDFYAIRPYAHGDSPRWIHWLSTIRMRKLMTRQFEAPVQRRVLLVLDCARPALPRGSKAAAFELAVTAAASVVRLAAETEHEVGLLTLGRHPLHIPPAAGMDTVRQMITALAAIKQDGRRGRFETGPVLTTGIQSLIVITSTPTNLFVQSMQALHGEGLTLCVVIASSLPEATANDGNHPINRLVAHGIPVCHARQQETLKHDLEHPLSAPTPGRGEWSRPTTFKRYAIATPAQS